jgi:hypothetical protein
VADWLRPLARRMGCGRERDLQPARFEMARRTGGQREMPGVLSAGGRRDESGRSCDAARWTDGQDGPGVWTWCARPRRVRWGRGRERPP